MSGVHPSLLLFVTLSLTSTLAPLQAEEDGGAYHFAIAKLLAAEGEVKAALEHFEAAVEADPADPYLRVEYAEFLSRVRRLQEAAAQAKRARELAPESLDVLRSFGQIHLSLAGRDTEALAAAEEVFEILREKEPHDVPSMLALARIYSGTGRNEEAVSVHEELVSHHPDNRRLKRLLVEALSRAGKTERMERILRETVSLDADALESRLRLAGLLSERSEHDAAIEMLRGAGRETREDPRLLAVLAQELFRRATSSQSEGEQSRRDLAEALETIDAVLAEGVELAAGRYLKSQILIAQERYAEAIEVLEELHEEVPEDVPVALNLAQLLEETGDTSAAVDLLKELSGRLSDPHTANEVRLRLAGLHARQQEWAGVVRVTERLLESELVEGELRSSIFDLQLDALVRLQRFKDALEMLKGEEKRGGASPELLLRRAVVLVEADRLGEARRLLRRPEVAKADSPREIVQRAGLLFALDQEEDAVALLERLAASGELEMRVLVARVYLSEERYQPAIPHLEQALGGEELTDRAELELRYMVGMSYERTSRYDSAAAAFRRVLEIDPEHAGALNYLGYMWADNGTNLEEALQLVEKAVSLDPENGAYVDSLGWAHFRLGHFLEAQLHLERAARLVPDDPTILEHLGDLYVELGELDQAREAYRRAVQINSEENVDKVRRKLSEL